MRCFARLVHVTRWSLLLTLLCSAPRAHADQLLETKLSSGPHAPGDAPDVIVHVPTHFDAQQPIHLLVFLHGFSSCARALVSAAAVACNRGGRPQRGYGLGAVHERAHINSLLIVPQLAFLERSADAPRFARAGGFDAMLRELQGGLLARTLGPAPNIASVTLLAHSAGYRAMATILGDPQRVQAVQTIVLFDALYAHWQRFARWYETGPDRRIVSLYTSDPKTTLGNRKLRAELGMVDHTATGQPMSQRNDIRISLQSVGTPHGRVPEQHMESVLRSLFGASPAH